MSLTTAKYVFGLILLLNWHSLPFFWHYRVLMPYFRFRFVEWLHYKRLPRQREKRKLADQQWWDKMTPVGRSPFDVVHRRKGFVGLDDADYNLHLSNSCYAKILDDTRMSYFIDLLPQFIGRGIDGQIPLGGTSFIYLKEIRVFSSFEVRLSTYTFGEKWIYCAAKFVSQAGASKRSSKKTLPAIATPADANSISPTPSLLASQPTSLDQLAAKLAAQPEADGATVHCISVSELCCKIGRVTIPPVLVFAMHGMGTGNLDGYRRMCEMASERKLKKFLVGGWKDEGLEGFLSDEVHAVRKERLGRMEAVRASMQEI